MSPMIGPGFVWFRTLRSAARIVRLYRPLPEIVDEPGPPAVPNTPGVLRRSPLAPVEAAAFSRVDPNVNVFPIRTFSIAVPGPRPKLRGRIFSPGVGLGSSGPYFVTITPGPNGSVAIPGRALNKVSP